MEIGNDFYIVFKEAAGKSLRDLNPKLKAVLWVGYILL